MDVMKGLAAHRMNRRTRSYCVLERTVGLGGPFRVRVLRAHAKCPFRHPRSNATRQALFLQDLNPLLCSNVYLLIMLM
jgi:hypothetical protein